MNDQFEIVVLLRKSRGILAGVCGVVRCIVIFILALSFLGLCNKYNLVMFTDNVSITFCSGKFCLFDGTSI